MSLLLNPRILSDRSASHAPHFVLLLTLVSACAAPGAPRPERGERYPTIRPGDVRIAMRRPTGAECFDLKAFGPDDTTGRSLGVLAVEWGERGAERADPTWIRTAFGQQSEDTMVYAGRSLAPRSETLRVGDQHITLRYRGAAVERMVQRGDSVEPWHAVTFDRPVFGFNQRELLLRVVRLQPSDTVILPLYSEIDAALELDTIALVPRESSRALAPTVQIRFADPAIVAIVTVDTLTSRIVDEEIRNRRRPGHLTRTLRPASLRCGS